MPTPDDRPDDRPSPAARPRLAALLREGDVPGARDMIRAGRTGGMPPDEMLSHAVRGDRPGVARMLAGEGAIDASRVSLDADADLLFACNVLPELLACGMRCPPGGGPLERALAAALADTRASLVAAGIMMNAADKKPDVYRHILSVAEQAPSGADLLFQAVSAWDRAETGGTPATR